MDYLGFVYLFVVEPVRLVIVKVLGVGINCLFVIIPLNLFLGQLVGFSKQLYGFLYHLSYFI